MVGVLANALHNNHTMLCLLGDGGCIIMIRVFCFLGLVHFQRFTVKQQAKRVQTLGGHNDVATHVVLLADSTK